MPRKKRRKPKPAFQPSAPTPKLSKCRALVVIDQEPIRTEALKAYLKVEKDIAKARAQVEAFEAGDLPAYARWEASVFGPLMTEMRDLAQQADAKRRLLSEIENEIWMTGCSEATAYRRVVLKEERPPGKDGKGPKNDEAYEDHEDPDFDDGEGPFVFGDSHLPPDFDLEEYDRWPAKRKRQLRETYKEMSELFEIFTGMPAPDFDDLIQHVRDGGNGRWTPRDDADPFTRDEPPPPHRSSHDEPVRPKDKLNPQQQTEAGRLKELYRALVRQLHPDKNGEQSERDREIWHQVQEAYRTRDLEWLEAVAGRIEIANKGAGSLPVQILQRMIREVRQALQGLRSQLSKIRKHPAWEFRKNTQNLSRFEGSRRKVLTRDRDFLKRDLAEMEEVLKDLATRADRERVRKASRKEPKKSRSKSEPGAKQAPPFAAQEMFPF